ncbi:hypothetical protein WBJ53_03775 [Spirosoma sp. SC4-14]
MLLMDLILYEQLVHAEAGAVLALRSYPYMRIIVIRMYIQPL